MIRNLKFALFLFLGLICCSCDSTSSNSSSGSGGGGTSSDYRFLYNHNAFELNGYTIRWETNTIKVYTAGLAGAEEAVNRWAGPINFTFVNSPPSDGVAFSSINSGGNICGVTNTYYLFSGKITQALVQITTNQTGCRGGLANTLTHEMGHALGFFGHTADGGLMDPDGGNSNITTAVRSFMNLLYTHPYGWNITPFIGSQINPTGTRYQPNSRQIGVRVDY